MNSAIKRQLDLVSVTKVEYSDTDTTIFIPKTIKILNTSVKQGEVYLIELKSSVTNPTDESTLASNWNNGVVPKHSKYMVEIQTKMANMVKVNGVAVDEPTDNFFGWLPIDGFTILSKL